MSCHKCGNSIPKPRTPASFYEELTVGKLCRPCGKFAAETFNFLRKINRSLVLLGCHQRIANRRTLVLGERLWQEYLHDKEKDRGRRGNFG